jgi:phospholipid/cholesterol/gamma-HCH transport system substrate-binding protein
MIADLNGFSAKLNQKGTLINDLVTDTSIVPDLKATMESLRVTSANTQALSKEFAGITDKLNSKDNSLGMLLNDPEFAKSLKKTMENADSASYNLNKGMEALEYTWPFNKGFKRKVKAEGGN